MANYVTVISDKSKRKAIRLLLCGGVGLHLFYVGRIKAGLIRLVIGFLMWTLFFAGITERETAMAVSGLVLLVLFNISDLIKLWLGTFRDNVGAVIREK